MPVAGSNGASTCSAPAWSHARRHGVTLASWSRRVPTTRSPGRSVAATARVNASVSVVMLAPNTMPSALRRRAASATRWRVRSSSASQASAAANAPPALALSPLGRPRRHGVDRGVDHLRAGRPVEAGPAVADAGEPGSQRRSWPRVCQARGTLRPVARFVVQTARRHPAALRPAPGDRRGRCARGPCPRARRWTRPCAGWPCRSTTTTWRPASSMGVHVGATRGIGAVIICGRGHRRRSPRTSPTTCRSRSTATSWPAASSRPAPAAATSGSSSRLPTTSRARGPTSPSEQPASVRSGRTWQEVAGDRPLTSGRAGSRGRVAPRSVDGGAAPSGQVATAGRRARRWRGRRRRRRGRRGSGRRRRSISIVVSGQSATIGATTAGGGEVVERRHEHERRQRRRPARPPSRSAGERRRPAPRRPGASTPSADGGAERVADEEQRPVRARCAASASRAATTSTPLVGEVAAVGAGARAEVEAQGRDARRRQGPEQRGDHRVEAVAAEAGVRVAAARRRRSAPSAAARSASSATPSEVVRATEAAVGSTRADGTLATCPARPTTSSRSRC